MSENGGHDTRKPHDSTLKPVRLHQIFHTCSLAETGSLIRRMDAGQTYRQLLPTSLRVRLLQNKVVLARSKPCCG